MIKNYSDHAANERTFLAWVRTAIAVMAFGFLVEKFDLFLHFMGQSAGVHGPRAPHQALGGVAGLSLIVLGMVIMVIATFRFVRSARDIDSADEMPGTGARLDIALAVMLTALGAALLLYLLQSLVGAS